MPDLDSTLVRHALSVAREQGYAEVQIGLNGSSFSAVLDPKKHKPKPALNLSEGPTEPVEKPIKANLVGYLQKVSIKPGEKVAKGAIVAVVTALGLANDIESQVSGEVIEVFCKEGDPVQYGEPIAMVIPE